MYVCLYVCTTVSRSPHVKINNFETEIVIVVVLFFTKGLISLKNVSKVEFNFLLRGKYFFDGNLSGALKNKIKLLGNWYKHRLQSIASNNGARRFL